MDPFTEASGSALATPAAAASPPAAVHAAGAEAAVGAAGTKPAAGARARLVFKGLAQAVWRWRGRTLLAVMLLIVAKLAAVGVPAMLKVIVDHFAPAQTAGSSPSPAASVGLTVPISLLLGYAALRYAGTLFTELRDLVFARVGKDVVSSFSKRAFAQLLAMSPRFHAQRNTGSLVREVERGTGGLGYLLGAGVFTVIPTIVEFGAVLVIILGAYGGDYVLVIAGSMGAYSLWTAWMTRARVHRQRAMNEHDSHAHGLLVDTLLNYEAVKTHGREDAELGRYGAVLERWVEGSIRSQHTLSALHLGQGAIIAIGVGGVMWMAGVATVAGRMSIGDLVMVNAYLIQVFLPLNTLGFVFRETRDALLNTETLFTLLGRESDIQDTAAATALSGTDTTVRFDDVSFGYDSNRPVLKHLTLEIPQGQTFAVVGGSGSGKSTLARLLMRMYDPDAGEVSIGGQALRDVTQRSLRQAIGVVPQDPMLFNDTIAYNIGYGRPDAPEEAIEAAARAAQADEFIQLLPERYATVVGERGARLSGGEKQRIAIARAFLKNPPIMVLDEATSALDTKAERAIQGALDDISRNRTSLIIAHRLSTVVDADQIIVMDRGEIVERGRHDELLDRRGMYAQLWELQRQQQQTETLERRIALHPVNVAGLLVLSLDGLREQLAAADISLYTDIDLDVASVRGDASRIARIVQLACQLALSGASDGRMEGGVHRVERTSQITIGFQGRLDPLQAPSDTLELRTLVSEAGGHLSIERDLHFGVQRYIVEFPVPALADAPMSEQELRVAPAKLAQAAVAQQETELESTFGLEPRPLTGLTVMCVDDDEDALESLGLLLEHDGARTERVSTGHEALRRLAERPRSTWPDVLVCDIALGAEDGHTVVRSLRTLEARRGVPLGRRLPAIALTGLAQPEDRLRALVAGFQRHMSKPVLPAALVRSLHDLAHARG